MKAQPKASHYINGRYVEDEQGAALPVIYPATGETIATLHSATPNVVELAVEAAREAQPAWARLKPVERGAHPAPGRRHPARTQRGVGATRNPRHRQRHPGNAGRRCSLGGRCAGVLRRHCRRLQRRPHRSRRPVRLHEARGARRLVGIGAWNYPIQGAGWKSAPALAMGNAMVFKPSEDHSTVRIALAEIFSDAGLPDGLFNVVQGIGDVGAALAVAPDSWRRYPLPVRCPQARRCWRWPDRR